MTRWVTSSATSSASRCGSTGGGRTRSSACVLATATSVPLFALGTRSFVNAVAAGNATRAMVLGALVGVLWIASIAIGHLVRPVAFELGDLNLIAFDAELIELGGGSAGLEHLENPEYANRLELARTEGGDLVPRRCCSSRAVAGIVLQLAVTMVLLATVRPVLLLLPLFAIPAMIGGRWAQAHVDAAKARTAETARMSRHLLQLLDAGRAGEGDPRLRPRRRACAGASARPGTASTEELSRAELRAAAARSGGQLVFVIGYVGALVLVVQEAIGGTQSVGARPVHRDPRVADHDPDVGIVLLTNQMQSMMRAVDGLNWLRDAAARQRPTREPDLPVPDAIRDGLVFEDVSFSLSGLEPTDPEATSTCGCPPDAVVALVGENGAGKSTLVKLIGRFYEPSRRHDHARRRGHPPLRPRRVARAAHGRLPGLRAARGARARDGRRRRPAERRRDAPSSSAALDRAQAAMSSRRCRRASRRRSGGRGRTAASSPAASGRSSRSAGR